MLNPRQKESLSIVADLISVFSALKDFALVLILPLFGILIGSGFFAGDKSPKEPIKMDAPPIQAEITPPSATNNAPNTQTPTEIQKACVELKFNQNKVLSSQFRESAKCFRK